MTALFYNKERGITMKFTNISDIGIAQLQRQGWKIVSVLSNNK